MLVTLSYAIVYFSKFESKCSVLRIDSRKLQRLAMYNHIVYSSSGWNLKTYAPRWQTLITWCAEKNSNINSNLMLLVYSTFSFVQFVSPSAITLISPIWQGCQNFSRVGGCTAHGQEKINMKTCKTLNGRNFAAVYPIY